jgi:hypothetical protein
MSTYSMAAPAGVSGDAADTKSCRHCRQSIAAKARLCQHCHGYQSFIGDQRDPRGWMLWIGIMLGFVALAVFWPMTGATVDASKFTVSQVAPKLVTTANGPRVFVVGRVDNASAAAGTRLWFRVNVYDYGDRLVDTFLADSDGLRVPANGTATFRLVASTSASEIGRVDVAVDRVGCK